MTNSRRIFTVLFTVGVAVVCSAAVASAHRGRVFGSSFGEPGSGAGQLSVTLLKDLFSSTIGGSGLAVNESTHDVYIADTGNSRVDEFTSSGTFVRAWGWGVVNGAAELQVCTEVTGCHAGLSGTNPGEFAVPAFVAIDNYPGGEDDVYVSDWAEEGSHGPAIVQKFTANGALIESWATKGQITPASVVPVGNLEDIAGIAVEPSGQLLVNNLWGVYGFDRMSGAYTGRIPPGGHIGTGRYVGGGPPIGLGVDRSGNFYIRDGGVGIQKYNSEGVDSNPAEIESGSFYPGIFRVTTKPLGLAVALSGELFVNEGGNTIQVVAASCVTLCTATATFTSPLLTAGAGLAVDSAYEVTYIVETAAHKIESIVPEPPAAPLVEAGSQSVSDVSGESAMLEATVSPRSEPNEEPTSYRFQYTTEESFQREGWAGAGSVPVPDGRLAPNFEEDRVMAHPQGLEAGTVYHYRVVAENAISRREGKPTEGERNEAGEEVVRTFTTQAPGVFALPDGRAWELVSPPNKHGGLIESLGVGETRASSDGEAFTFLAQSPTESQPAGNEDLAQVLSTRSGGSWGSRDIATPHVLATGSTIETSAEYSLFSEDLSSAVVDPIEQVFEPLSPEASEHTPYLRTDYVGGGRGDPCVSACYRPLVTGAPGFANVLEGVKFGEVDSKGRCTGGEKCHGPGAEGASPDGRHIVLSSKVPLLEGAPAFSLYEWTAGGLELVSVLPGGGPAPNGADLGGSVTQQVSGYPLFSEEGAVSVDGSRIVFSTSHEGERVYVRDVPLEETVEVGGVGAGFESASADGSRLLYTFKGDLYVWEAPLDGPLSAGHVTDLAPGAEVQELILGMARDGSAVYFVGHGVLTSVPAANGETARAGQANLYVYRGGVTRLVAVLSGEDAHVWVGPGTNQRHMTSSRVSPDGGWLAFMSDRSLTGYDNLDAVSGQADEEVFLYDANANAGAGRLVCASCDPTGARPHGFLDTVEGSGLLEDKQGIWFTRWLSGSLPAWTSLSYQSRYLADGGRLFFNSTDPLVASDTNGAEDVYEYEPPGVGNCSVASATFIARSGGCVDLVSSGTAREGAVFLDASENGNDVFFFTSGQLAPQDIDASRDVYDARVGGGVPVPQPPPACEGDACQSPMAPPIDQTPGSLTYRGPGNPVALLAPAKTTKEKPVKCAKGRKLLHGKCVKQARRARRAGRVGNGRRVK